MSDAATQNCYYAVMVSITAMNTSLTALEGTIAETANLFSALLSSLYDWGNDVLQEDADDVSHESKDGDGDDVTAAQTKYNKDSTYFQTVQGIVQGMVNASQTTVSTCSSGLQQLVSLASIMNQDGSFIASALVS